MTEPSPFSLRRYKLLTHQSRKIDLDQKGILFCKMLQRIHDHCLNPDNGAAEHDEVVRR